MAHIPSPNTTTTKTHLLRFFLTLLLLTPLYPTPSQSAPIPPRTMYSLPNIANITPSELNALYSSAINAAANNPPPSDTERKQNPFMLTRESEREVERIQKEGGSGRERLLEVEEVREKYLWVVGVGEEVERREREGREEGGGGSK